MFLVINVSIKVMYIQIIPEQQVRRAAPAETFLTVEVEGARRSVGYSPLADNSSLLERLWLNFERACSTIGVGS